jgi:C4-dicarboxylate-specific signal transduction histidine kinase
MRAFFKKAPTPKELLDVNEVIQEVLMLSQGEVRRNRISVRTRFANDLPFVMGTRPQGLGMGLTISRSIIEAHGGHLRAKANAPRGAVFQFILPIHVED